MWTGASVLVHSDRSVLTEQCKKKGEGHEYGSMQTGAISFLKNITFDFLNVYGIVNRELTICFIIING